MSKKDLLNQISSAIEPAEVEVGYRHRKSSGNSLEPHKENSNQDNKDSSHYVELGLMSHDTTDDGYEESIWNGDGGRSRGVRKASTHQLKPPGQDANLPFSRDELSEEGYYFLTEEEQISNKMYFAVAAAVFGITLGAFALGSWML